MWWVGNFMLDLSLPWGMTVESKHVYDLRLVKKKKTNTLRFSCVCISLKSQNISAKKQTHALEKNSLNGKKTQTTTPKQLNSWNKKNIVHLLPSRNKGKRKLGQNWMTEKKAWEWQKGKKQYEKRTDSRAETGGDYEHQVRRYLKS